MNVLNLYAGIGGNRKLWGDVDITAVERDPSIAQIYADYFPNDTLIIGDAHEYLRCNYHKFDFIWTSPPCQTHSSFRQNIGVRYRGVDPVYPDMTLYQEIIFLQHNAECLFVVENVNPYYDVLIPAYTRGRHLFWANWAIPPFKSGEKTTIRSAQIPQLSAMHGYDLTKYNVPNKRQILRNCVDSGLGLHILEGAKRHMGQSTHADTSIAQTSLF